MMGPAQSAALTPTGGKQDGGGNGGGSGGGGGGCGGGGSGSCARDGGGGGRGRGGAAAADAATTAQHHNSLKEHPVAHKRARLDERSSGSGYGSRSPPRGRRPHQRERDYGREHRDRRDADRYGGRDYGRDCDRKGGGGAVGRYDDRDRDRRDSL